MIKTKFYVRSDVDDNNIRADFDDQVDAIAYASGFSPADKCYVVEATVDVDEESGEVLRELESETIWTFEDLPTEDAFGVNDWPDVSIKDEEEMKLNTDFDVKDMHEELEAREDLVECQHCFDLFPKESCTKIEYGYLCPHCHSLVVKEVELPSEMTDDATFGLEFPEPYDFENTADENEVPSEYTEISQEEPVAIETPVEEMPEVSIETPVAFAEIPVTADGGIEDGSSDDSSDDEKLSLTEDVNIADYKYKVWVEIPHTDIAYYVLSKAETKDEAWKEVEQKYPDVEIDLITEITPEEKEKNILEHVQDRPAPIEDTTELHGMDNAVVDCQTDMKVIAHSEDEKPLDCLMKKPALEEPLAGENKLTESFDDELIAFAASLPEDLHEEALDEGIFGIITANDIDKKFSSDGYIVIGRNKDGSEKERKSFNHFKDAETYAQNFSKLSNNGTSAIIAVDHGKNTTLKAFDNGKEALNTIKDIFKEIKKDDKEAKSDIKAMKKMAKAEEKPVEEPKAEDKPVEEAPKEETPTTKRDMSKQNEARAQYKKIEKALEILGVNKDVLRDGNKVTQKFKDLRKALFTESYPDILFDSDVKEGDKIRIIHLEGEDNSYDGKEGTVERIDSIGQLHGTWGGLAIIPGVDDFEIISESLKEAKKDEEKPTDPDQAKLDAHTMLNNLVADEIEAIDGYEAAKAELLDKPLEHKEEIIHTIDHIKDEEKEHIDELIQATRKIPFEKPTMEELDEDIITEKPVDCLGEKKPLEKPLAGKNVDVKLSEAKKDDELPVDPEAAKLEVHTMLNDLVADEIEAINGYDDAKAEIVNTPIEHKDNILDTIDHIKGEEQEHIDELIDATTEIPFDKEENHDFAAEEDALAEETHAKYAKPEGDSIAAYNNALKYAKKENKPFIYGYTNHTGKFFAAETPMKVTGSPADAEKEFRSRYKNCNVVYVAYPDKEFISEELHKNEEALVAEWARQGVETGMIFDESDYDQFAKICKIEGIEPSKELFKHYFKCIDDLVGVKEESLEFTCDQDLADDRTPAQEKQAEFEEPVDGAEVRKHEHAIKEDVDDEIETCAWCGEEYPISELHKEVDLGYLCPDCEQAIKSRGEKLIFEE